MLELNVKGMNCGHCVRAVTGAITGAYPEAQVEVDLAAGRVRVDRVADADAVARLIEEEGYEVVRSA